jgi:predicted O-methyltransferase YrrM
MKGYRNMTLLIHSMSEFSEIIVHAMDAAKISNIAEIGSEYGGMTSVLANHAEANDGHLFSVDPAPKSEFLSWVADHQHVTHIPKPRLDAVADLKDIDVWFVDGDHNLITVYN